MKLQVTGDTSLSLVLLTLLLPWKQLNIFNNNNNDNNNNNNNDNNSNNYNKNLCFVSFFPHESSRNWLKMCKEHIHFSNLLIYATHVKDPLLHSESFTGLHCILHKLVVIPLKPAETCLNLRTGMLLLQQKYSFFYFHCILCLQKPQKC